MDTTLQIRKEDGTVVRLDRAVSRTAGFGTLFTIEGASESVAIILHEGKRTPRMHDKVRAMTRMKPPARPATDKSTGAVVPTVAWPEALLTEDGSFCGYLMPRVDLSVAVPIAVVENPARREKHDWTSELGIEKRAIVAMNLAFLLGQIHRRGVVVGDLNQSNVLVSASLIVTFFDCCSMQIKDSQGRDHLCEASTPGFVAPELVGKDFQVHARYASSDLFNLAVHAYLLLLDRHPFRNGIYTGNGEKPAAEVLAQHGQWRGRRGGVLAATETRSLDPQTFLPQPLQRLFERAFEDGATSPEKRATEGEWITALREFVGMPQPSTTPTIAPSKKPPEQAAPRLLGRVASWLDWERSTPDETAAQGVPQPAQPSVQPASPPAQGQVYSAGWENA